jgi:hypothetical protein
MGDRPVYLRAHAVSIHWKVYQDMQAGLAEADNIHSKDQKEGSGHDPHRRREGK